jgi:error-prone DNA polymerase
MEPSLVAARGAGFRTLEALRQRVPLGRRVLENLIMGGACDGWGVRRRDLLWRLGRSTQPMLLDDLPTVALPVPTANERLAIEYAILGVSSGESPAALFRQALLKAGAVSSDMLKVAPRGAWVRVGGQVIIRQRPVTAKGILFVTLQDELGQMNLVVMPDVLQGYRTVVRAPGLLAEGVVEQDRGVVNVMVKKLWALWPEST